MEINKVNAPTFTTNPEGSLVYDRNPRIQLYLEGSNLNIKKDLFYETDNQKLNAFIKSAQAEKDEEYLAGLAKFLSDLGLKLSPVVLSVILANMGYKFKDSAFLKIFNTPQRIAEAIVLGKTYKLNNAFKKKVLRNALEGFSEFTLRKNRMQKRKIKTADLIKLLRPKPKNDSFAKLYKAIIENSKEAHLKAEDTLVSMKSSGATEEQKLDYYKQNIERIPLNQLIRNLKFIVEKANYSQETELLSKIITRLSSVEDLRFLNVFDLIEASINVPALQKPLFEVTKNFVAKIKAKNDLEFKEATVMFDISGSMEDEGKGKGFKYLVLMALLYDKLSMRFFNMNLYNADKAGIIESIKSGNLIEAYGNIKIDGATALVACTKALLQTEPETKELIVISDEVSWSEGGDLIGYIRELNEYLKNVKMILINPVIYKGTVFGRNVVGIASLTSSIILDMSIFKDAQKFINYIKNYKKNGNSFKEEI